MTHVPITCAGPTASPKSDAQNAKKRAATGEGHYIYFGLSA